MLRSLVPVALAVLAWPRLAGAGEAAPPWWRPTHVAVTGIAAAGASDEVAEGEGATAGVGLALGLEAPRWDAALELGLQDFLGVRGTRYALLGGVAQNLGSATRLALAAELGFQRYTHQDSEGLLGSTRVLDANSVTLPYLGARASLLWRIGIARRVVLGLSAFARTTPRREFAVYSYESCGLFGCGTGEGVDLYGGASYGLMFIAGARFALPAGGAPAASTPDVAQP